VFTPAPTPAVEPVSEEFNPFAGFVVPGSAAEAMTRDDDHGKKKRRRDDDDEDNEDDDDRPKKRRR